MKKSIMKNLFKTVLLFGSALFLSCEIGLGEAIDLEAPTITITSPERNSTVAENVVITGVAVDNIGITCITVSIPESGQSFRYNGTNWEENAGGWQSYGAATVSGSNQNLSWSLPVAITGAVSGNDYTIVTQVFDALGNESKNSKDERLITVDVQEPNVSIIEPSLVKTSYSDAFNANASYELKKNDILIKLINKTFTISGSQKEDARLSYLKVYLDEGIDFTVPTYPDPMENCIVTKKITGDNLRNWSLSVSETDFPGSYQTGKHLLRLITESHDQAGNVERKAHGWFTYWNEADKPWINAEFGGISSDTKTTVYPSCTLQGQAYDDDGLAEFSIEVKVRKPGASEDEVVLAKTKVENLAIREYPTYYAWSVDAMGEKCDYFSVSVKVKDKFGVESETVTKYMDVQDVNPPTITVTNPVNGKSMIAFDGSAIESISDATGKITLAGSISDDGAVKSLKIVHISNKNEASQIKYFNTGYTEWSKATSIGFVDENGNKIWDVNLNPETLANGIHTRTFSKDFNLFTDFGINGTELLTTQTFILLASDGTEATVELVSYSGDTDAPSLTFDEITIYEQNGTVKEKQSLSSTPSLLPFNRNTHGITDYAELTGTWSDNSTTLWGDKEKISSITVNWSGTTVTVTKNSDGTWKSDPIVLPDSTTATLSANIKDWGGNSTTATANFYINSSLPQYSLITSNNSDGVYGVHDVNGNNVEIEIVTQFNKKVTFSGGTSDPVLHLNNGKTAVYASGNRESKHVYKYKVAAGDDVSALNVISIDINGNEWKDEKGASIADITAIPTTGTTSLAGGRTITIDTVAPKLATTPITLISPNGYYNLGKEIFIKADFNEDVTFTDVTKLRLKLQLEGETVYTDSCSKAGARTVLFKYVIDANQNATPLKIIGFELNGCNVKDKAENSMVAPSIATVTTGINIDTIQPAKPTIVLGSGVVDGKTVYNDTGAKFTITDFENISGTKKEYSIDGGQSWATYTEEITVLANGSYTITARQTDAAGNISSSADQKTFTIDKGKILNSLTSNKTDGTYKTGDKIQIILNFRKPVTVSGASLTLNALKADGTTKQTAVYKSGSGTTKLYFEYTVQAGDSCVKLDVDALNGTWTDANSQDISDFIKLTDVTTGNKFTDNRNISIVTGVPVVQSVVFDTITENSTTVPVLKITFSSPVSKAAGKDIEIKQSVTGYKAPAILSKSLYTDYYNINSAFETYYESSTNGSTSTGESDLSEKYVLKYQYNTDNTALCNLFKSATIGALNITIPVTSSSVQVDEENTNVLIAKLTESYKIPVKGANYTITIPSGLVNDVLNNPNTAPTDTTLTFPGIEAPVIRIKKSAETLAQDIMPVQPTTAEVKMDCQTPGAKIYYVKDEKTIAPKTLNKETIYDNTDIYAENTTKPSISVVPNTTSTEYESSAFSIGSADDTTNGYRILLRARATKDSKWSEDSYESAFRTVVIMNHGVKGDGYDYMWLRGGDWTNGGVSTPNFPLSWKSSEFNKVRGMTQVTGSDKWYWISWNINTTAYVAPLSGDMPADCAENGPYKWVWATQSYIPLKEKSPIYPGESFQFEDFKKNPASDNDNIAFQGKHCEYRSGTVVKSGEKHDYDSKISASTAFSTGDVIRVKYVLHDDPEYSPCKFVIKKKNSADVYYTSATLSPVLGQDYSLDVPVTWAGADGFDVYGYGISLVFASVPIVIPDSAVEILLNGPLNGPDWGNCVTFNIARRTYSAGQILYITTDKPNGGVNLRVKDWGAMLIEGIPVNGEGLSKVVITNEIASALNDNTLALQANGVTVTSIKWAAQ